MANVREGPMHGGLGLGLSGGYGGWGGGGGAISYIRPGRLEYDFLGFGATASCF